MRINFWGMSNYFYKHNTISFTNYTFDFDLSSNVSELSFFRCENLALDSRLLNPDVFKRVLKIYTDDSVKLIGHEIFGHFENLNYFLLKSAFFRKLVHKQGIEWVKSKNRNLRVNLSDTNELARHQEKIFQVSIKFFWGTSRC